MSDEVVITYEAERVSVENEQVMEKIGKSFGGGIKTTEKTPRKAGELWQMTGLPSFSAFFQNVVYKSFLTVLALLEEQTRPVRPPVTPCVERLERNRETTHQSQQPPVQAILRGKGNAGYQLQKIPPWGGSQHRDCLDTGLRRRPAKHSWPGRSPDPL